MLCETIYVFLCFSCSSPELFDYEALVGGDCLENLQHAFTLGYEKLGILRLLDPEGEFWNICWIIKFYVDIFHNLDIFWNCFTFKLVNI